MSTAIEKLRNILILEKERNYDNRAVFGGLDKFFPSLELDTPDTDQNKIFLKKVWNLISQYRGASTDIRAVIVKALSEEIKKPGHEKQSLGALSDPQKPPKPVFQPIPPAKKITAPKISNISDRKRNEVNSDIGINAPLTIIPGIGPAHAKKLSELGLKTLGDLLYHFPRRYDDYSKLKQISKVQYGEELTLIGTIEFVYSRPYRSGKQKIIEAVLSDGTGSIKLIWFNSPFLERQIKPGMQIVVSGKIDTYLGRFVITNPDWEHVDQEHLLTNRIVPVYPLTAQISQKWLRKTMFQTVRHWGPRVTDFLPDKIKHAASLPDLNYALLRVHFPEKLEEIKFARERLAFDEIFLLQLGVLEQKYAWQSQTAEVFTAPDDWIERILGNLPFTLTNAQLRIISEIREDLASGSPMNRLIQGDVGSGKTIIAAVSSFIINSSNAQVALMAPTSILAEQHFKNVQDLCKRLSSIPNIPAPEEIRILIGNTPEKEKAEILTGLEVGKIKIIIGTHALIEDQITFHNLKLAIVDEQHRFGVSQRALLRSKGTNPHLLVMTATPIPRSLALTVYGDLDLSVLDELPQGRQPIETHVIHPLERERAYQLIRNQVDRGFQAFIIYPLIEQSETIDSKAAVDEYNRIKEEVFPNDKIGLLHGRLRPEEKDAVMQNFSTGKIDILVSTSVVEVGVDVPNATVMLIEGANRFGLAQLHQFRGRVGRSHYQSYCLLIPENEDSIENERLAVMAETNDGFILAEKDLEQRGPGEFLGTRQSGYADLKMANLMDVHLIEKARKFAKVVYDKDPKLSLPANREIAAHLSQFWRVGKGDIS